MIKAIITWIESLVDRFADRMATHRAEKVAYAVTTQLAETLPIAITQCGETIFSSLMDGASQQLHDQIVDPVTHPIRWIWESIVSHK